MSIGTWNPNEPHPTTLAVAGGTLAIPLSASVVLKTTGGVEALTLADGEQGQRLMIQLVADSGDGTLTPATATGWATIVFEDVGDTAILEWDDVLGWLILSLHGLAGPPPFTV